MRAMTILSCLSALAAAPASAQDGMTDEIRNAFGQINSRLDAIDSRLRALEVKDIEPAPVQHDSSASQPQARSGWQVHVYEASDQSDDALEIATYQVAKGSDNLWAKPQGIRFDHPVRIRAQAYFRAGRAGKYTFALSWPSRPDYPKFRCDYAIEIEGQYNNKFRDYDAAARNYLAVDLEAGVFAITYEASCQGGAGYDANGNWRENVTVLGDDMLQAYENLEMTARVKGPGDRGLRSFENAELFYLQEN